MRDFTSDRMRGIDKTLIRRINDLKDSSSIDLGLGELKFPTPAAILDHVKARVNEWNLGYTPNEGLPELRDLIARDSGYEVTSDQVCVTVGAEEALFGLLMVLVNPGDEVLVPDPGYPAYPSIVNMAGGTPRAYSLFSEDGFGLKSEEVERHLTKNTRPSSSTAPTTRPAPSI